MPPCNNFTDDISARGTATPPIRHTDNNQTNIFAFPAKGGNPFPFAPYLDQRLKVHCLSPGLSTDGNPSLSHKKR